MHDQSFGIHARTETDCRPSMHKSTRVTESAMAASVCCCPQVNSSIVGQQQHACTQMELTLAPGRIVGRACTRARSRSHRTDCRPSMHKSKAAAAAGQQWSMHACRSGWHPCSCTHVSHLYPGSLDEAWKLQKFKYSHLKNKL